MRKIPNTIKLKSKVKYEIIFADVIGEKESTMAECRYDFKQIVIKNGQSETETWKSFIHELIHAIEFEFRIPIPHKITYLLEDAVFRVAKINGYLD